LPQRHIGGQWVLDRVYLSCYYLGSSVGGTLGGLTFSAGGWNGVTLYAAAFVLAVIGIGLTLRRF
jgi:YNFM family putative membrane transporter